MCGSDGNTHSNECEMGRTACEQDIEITVAYPGECGPGMKSNILNCLSDISKLIFDFFFIFELFLKYCI